MKHWERIAAITLFLIGIGGAIGAWKIGFGDFQTPGPGFFPFWLAALLAVLSLAFFVRNLGADTVKVTLWAQGVWVRPLKAACVMFVYVLLIGRLGFISSSALLFIAWLRIVEHSSWKTVVLLVIGGTTCLYLFTSLLSISLPAGILI
jgi:hypothetical protein